MSELIEIFNETSIALMRVIIFPVRLLNWTCKCILSILGSDE